MPKPDKFETIDDVADQIVSLESENRFLRLALFMTGVTLVVSLLANFCR